MKLDHFENQPALWGQRYFRPDWRTHKYHRGHVFVVSGGRYQTGAARLAAESAQRIGAGLVTVLSSTDAADINAAHLTGVMLRVVDSAEDVAGALSEKDQYARVVVIGPGAGDSDGTRAMVLAALASSARTVLDADGLTSFAEDSDRLFEVLGPDEIITPHEGEFVRLFGDIADADRLGAARSAAARAGCVCVLKGADTIVAAPDGRASIAVNAPPDLATAGAGDVLAGIIAGLSANGMPSFEAASAGVWFHGAAGLAVGPGLTAEDLPRAVPAVLRNLLAPPAKEGAPGQ